MSFAKIINQNDIILERDEKENKLSVIFEIKITDNCNIIESIKEKKLLEILAEVNKPLIEKVDLLSYNEDKDEDDYILYFSNISDDNDDTKLYLMLNTKIHTESNKAQINFVNSKIKFAICDRDRILFKNGHINIYIINNTLKYNMVFQFIEIKPKDDLVICYLLRKLSWKFKQYLINL
jgi:hypothetical protein